MVVMVKAYERIKVLRGDKCIEVTALFDTGSGKSYLSEGVARKLGYELYEKPYTIPLAVKGKYAEVIGYVPAYLEILGYRTPGVEALEVVKDLFVDAIIGRNIMDAYDIIVSKEGIRFMRDPPTPTLI